MIVRDSRSIKPHISQSSVDGDGDGDVGMTAG